MFSNAGLVGLGGKVRHKAEDAIHLSTRSEPKHKTSTTQDPNISGVERDDFAAVEHDHVLVASGGTKPTNLRVVTSAVHR